MNAVLDTLARRDVVLVTGTDLAEPAVALLSDYELVFAGKAPDEGCLAALCREYQPVAIIVRYGRITARVMDASAKLRVISKHGTGTDTIDKAAAAQRGIVVNAAVGANAAAVAEHTWALILACAKDVALLDRRMHDGHWDKATHKSLELRGRTLALVGLGAIGARVAATGLSLGMRVIAHDPYATSAPDGVELLPLADVIAGADVLSLHCPLTPDNANMLDAAALATMRPGAIVVNTARGGLVDEAALADALRSGALRAAGLDSFQVEPFAAGHPFTGIGNVILSPHIGGVTSDAYVGMGTAAARNVLAVVEQAAWFPAAYRGRIVAIFMVAVPMSSFVGSPLSAMLLQLDGLLGLRGWHWLFILEGIPTVLMGFACLFFLTDRPAQAAWLTTEQRDWLVARLESDQRQRKAGGHAPLREMFRSKEVLGMVLVCATASSAGTVLGVWQPQLLRSFGLTVMETGLLNAVPYVIAAALMVWWGRHSDKKNERRWHTAIPLALIAGGMLCTLFVTSLAPVMVLLSCVLIGAYSFKGPFWALSSSWLRPSWTAGGLALINAGANLIGGGLMVNVYGWIKEATGSYSLALLPIAILAAASIVTLLSLSSEARQAARNAAVKAA